SHPQRRSLPDWDIGRSTGRPTSVTQGTSCCLARYLFRSISTACVSLATLLSMTVPSSGAISIDNRVTVWLTTFLSGSDDLTTAHNTGYPVAPVESVGVGPNPNVVTPGCASASPRRNCSRFCNDEAMPYLL